MEQHLNTPLETETSNRIIARMRQDYGLSQNDASAIMQETLVFLNMVGRNPGCPSSPSPLVDIGWHTFILYTREYTEYCHKVCGSYIHHRPTDTAELRADAKPVQATVDFMSSNGIVYNPELWDSGPNHCDDRCSSHPDRHCDSGESHPRTAALVMAGADCDNGQGGCEGWGGPGGCS